MKTTRFYKTLFLVTLLCFINSVAWGAYFDNLNATNNKADCRFVVKKIYFEKLIDFNYVQNFTASSELFAIAAKKNDPVLEAYANLIMGRHYASGAFWKEEKALS